MGSELVKNTIETSLKHLQNNQDKDWRKTGKSASKNKAKDGRLDEEKKARNTPKEERLTHCNFQRQNPYTTAKEIINS